MQKMTLESVQPFSLDVMRNTTVGRYLSQREDAFIQCYLGSVTPSCRALDIACGSGHWTLPLHNAGFHVMGLDLNQESLLVLQQKSGDIPLSRANAERLPFNDGSFDYVLASQCFEFLNHRPFLRECNRILTYDGLLIFDFLNRHSYKWLLKQISGRTEYLTLSSANLSYREVLRAVADHGFGIQAVSGYNWIPFTRESNSSLVGATALIEQKLRLDRFYNISPKLLVAARKRSLS
jgi:ubiquinone/menaquinone biosynthesis C-methylase UbiE